MTIQEKHAGMVRVLAKSGEEILDSLTPIKCHQLHMLIGMMTELGELADAFKKHLLYGKPLDLVNVKEEGGDLQFYHQGLRHSVGITSEDELQYNFEKLGVRYPGFNYTDEAAVARADKNT